MEADPLQANADFSEAERDAVYKCIHNRRDVRVAVLPDPVSDEVLARILQAAHHAPSVGFIQPWDFIVVRDQAVKRQVTTPSTPPTRKPRRCSTRRGGKPTARSSWRASWRARSVRVTCDRSRSGPVVIGRTHQAEIDLLQRLSRRAEPVAGGPAENIGVGWVSILRHDDLRAALGIPASIQPIAISAWAMSRTLFQKPELEAADGCRALKLADVLWFDRWHARTGTEPLLGHIG